MSGGPSYRSTCATCADYIKRSKRALLNFRPYPQAWSLDQDLLSRSLNSKEEKVAKLLFENGAEIQPDTEDDVNVKSKKTLLHCAVETNDIETTKSLLQKNVDLEAGSDDDSTPLHVAARMGNTEIAEVLLDHGAEANSVCASTLGALLHIAVKQRKASLVETLLKKGTNMNANVKDEGTLLVLAAKRRSLKVVKVLLNNGADIDARDKDNKNIVRFAVKNRVFVLIELLLEAHADPENNRGCFHTAVDGAISEPRSKIPEALLRYGFGLNCEDSVDANSLHIAVCRGYPKIVEYLLTSDTEFDVETMAEDGAKPLHAAVQYKQIEIARLLIKKNADVNAKDEKGNTPLHYAVRNFDVDMTELLLAHGADLIGEPDIVHKATFTLCKDFVKMLFRHEPTMNVNGTNELGMSVLYRSIACTYIQFRIAKATIDFDTCIRDIATILLDKGADVNARTKNGTTALHAAVQRGYQKVVELLLEHKADVNAVGKERETPLHYSARNGNEKIVKILLDAGAMVNAERKNGATALHVAIEGRHAEVVKLLVENGADVAVRNKNGSTPLHIAAAHCNSEVLEILLNGFEDIDCRETSGKTALHIATMRGHPRTVRLLLDHGSDINVFCKCGKTPLGHAIGDSSSDDCDDSSNDDDEDDEDDDNDEDDDSVDYDEDDETVDYDEDDDSDGADDSDDSNDSDDPDEKDHSDKDENDYSDESDEDTDYDEDDNSCHDAEWDAYNSDEVDGRFEEVGEMLCQHAIKMVAMNRRVNAKNLRCMDFINGHYQKLSDNCEHEIECMRQKKIGVSSVSYYDVLTNDMNRLAVYARNKDVVDALETGDHKNMFYLYLDMLKIRFKKGQKRAALLDSSIKSLSFLTGFALPDLSIGKILNYLSNRDLDNLIKAGPCIESDS